MKKAVYHGVRDIRIEEVPEPQPGPDEVKIKVKYCGICGSDLHEYLHGLFPESPFGHEICGEILAVGSDVSGFEVGDRVVAFQKGGFGERLVAPLDQVLAISAGISWKRAALLEPLAGAAYAVEKGRVKATDTVLIVGGGPVGLMLLLAVKELGVARVYVSEPCSLRREKALELGATAVFDPSQTEVAAEIRRLTAKRGVDVAIEAVGNGAALKDCLSAAGNRGIVIVQGIFTERVPIHMLAFVTREITMIGANSKAPALARRWIESGNIEPEIIVTHVIPLEDLSERGFEVLTRDKDTAIKILVKP
jgi:(R,R)-butanediol dehydrogenase/meso-butanediol dehydrogenase/diacetyl reductase